jgi:SMC interacting uncharacterized protein involved in chromosome segregation
MALTRKFLSALGIESDKIDEIINAHAETVDALKEERDNYKNYKADAEKLPEVQKELDDLKKTVEDGGNVYEKKYNELKETYDKEKQEYENFKNEVTAKELLSKKDAAYRKLLKESGVSEKRIDSILKVSDLSTLDFDKDNKLKDSDKLMESIKTEWADFIEIKGEKGADNNNPPENNGGTGKSGRAAQLAAQYHDNRYGTNKEE